MMNQMNLLLINLQMIKVHKINPVYKLNLTIVLPKVKVSKPP